MNHLLGGSLTPQQMILILYSKPYWNLNESKLLRVLKYIKTRVGRKLPCLAFEIQSLNPVPKTITAMLRYFNLQLKDDCKMQMKRCLSLKLKNWLTNFPYER